MRQKGKNPHKNWSIGYRENLRASLRKINQHGCRYHGNGMRDAIFFTAECEILSSTTIPPNLKSLRALFWKNPFSSSVSP